MLLPMPELPPVTTALLTRDRKSTRLNSSHVAISYAVSPHSTLFPYTTLFRSTKRFDLTRVGKINLEEVSRAFCTAGFRRRFLNITEQCLDSSLCQLLDDASADA